MADTLVEAMRDLAEYGSDAKRIDACHLLADLLEALPGLRYAHVGGMRCEERGSCVCGADEANAPVDSFLARAREVTGGKDA